MTSFMPPSWMIAHRCVDLSDRLGSNALEALMQASKLEENALTSMEKRFHDGIGIETDLRGDSRTDEAGILISHDLPVKGKDYPTLDAVFSLYKKAGTNGCLALNIKDAGLQTRLKP